MGHDHLSDFRLLNYIQDEAALVRVNVLQEAIELPPSEMNDVKDQGSS